MNYSAIAQAYHQNGFEVVRGLFSADELREVVTEVEGYLAEALSEPEPGEVQYEDGPEKSLRCVFRMEKRSNYFRKLLGDPRLIRVVEELFGGAEVVQDGVMLINKAPHASYDFPYHQDNAYQFMNPPEAVALTLSLDAATAENGTIACLKGSHTIGVLPHQPSGVRGASLGLVQSPDTVAYPEVALSMRPGEVSLHHVNVIHRTGPNQTGDHRRNLGFAYHSVRAKRDEEANARYQQHLKRLKSG